MTNDPKKCTACKDTMHWAINNIGNNLAPLAVKIIIDDNRHFHL